MQKKKGISLIVLVITIIVMIILAAAVIISLDNSGIIERANSAVKQTNKKTEKMQDSVRFLLSLNEKEWTGNVATGFGGGTGTESDPYLITNAEELAYFAKVVNKEIEVDGLDPTFEGKYVSITNTINLGGRSFTPIAYGLSVSENKTSYEDDSNWQHPIPANIPRQFNGTLDGNDNIICRINITREDEYYVGLIGVLGEKGTVKNLHVYNGTVQGTSEVGGIVGASKGVIKNCTSLIDVKAQGIENNDYAGHSTGGIVGAVFKGSIANCKNYGTVISKNNRSGGIVGFIYITDSDVFIENCENECDISGYQASGGIVGRIASINDKKVEISKCYNSGKIYSTDLGARRNSGDYIW